MPKMDSVKTIIFIATTCVGVTLYAHERFATNKRLDQVSLKQAFQHKVICLMAIKLKVSKKKIAKICDLEL